MWKHEHAPPAVPFSLQRLLRFEGDSGERHEPDDDEVLYVLAGEGELEGPAAVATLVPGTAVHLGRGTTWRIHGAKQARDRSE